MKNKKLVALGLTSVVALSMTAPAFAAANTATKFTGTFEEVDIDVTVPTAAAVTINPYGLEVTIQGTGEDAVKLTGQQIATAPAMIKNNSSMDLMVSAEVAPVTIKGAAANAAAPTDDEKAKWMKLSAVSTQGSGTEGTDDYVAPATSKSAYIVFQMTPVTGNTITDFSTVADDEVAKAYKAWDKDATSDKDIVLSATKTMKQNDILCLKKADTNGTVKEGCALARLAGDCVMTPKVEWAATDGIETTVSYTFTPGDYTAWKAANTPAPDPAG